MLDRHHHKRPLPDVMTVAEFAYRANHRRQEAGLFDRLIETTLTNKSITYQQLVTGVRSRFRKRFARDKSGTRMKSE